jgi:sialate O-acetylesterase
MGMALSGLCNISLPAILGSHMVLQQQSEITFWGWCAPMETVKITVGWDNRTYITNGQNNAKWSVKIKTPTAGGPYHVSITGNNHIDLDDVMIGEVWLCAGQSNMALSASSGIKQAIDEIPHANNNKIRLFYAEKSTSEFPQEDCKGHWVVCNPEDFKRFSAVGYFFGKKLQETLKLPVGLINANWEGSSAEVWTPSELIAKDSLLRSGADRVWKSDEWWPSKPGLCFNAMIYPLSNYNIAGAIWYQGESNADASSVYQKTFYTMIHAWREAWKKDFPFYFVQVAPFSGYAANNAGALLREAQSKSMNIPNTGMVVISDLVNDVNDIHPQNKLSVASRLANYALAETYHKSGIAYKSPVFNGMRVERNKIRIQFKYADDGLVSKNGQPTEFFIAAADKKFVPATARIKNNSVIVFSSKVNKPVAVRFGFSNAATPNLFSAQGLPVNTFRTDNWN